MLPQSPDDLLLRFLLRANFRNVRRAAIVHRLPDKPAPDWYMKSVAGQAIGFLRDPNLKGEDVVLGFSRIAAVLGGTVSATEPRDGLCGELAPAAWRIGQRGTREVRE